MKRIYQRLIAIMIITASLALPCLAACSNNEKRLNVSITIWHYYNDVQNTAFEALISEFNDTVGARRGIAISAEPKGTNTTKYLEYVLSAAEKKVGSETLADMFLAYPDTAKAVDKLMPLADLNKYFSSSELAEYDSDFLEEGRLDLEGTLKNFPFAKSTEIFTLNKTEWDLFVADVPTATLDKLTTIEGLIEVSELYFNWSDGKAFYGRDSIANYFIIGAKQFGVDLFGVDENDNAIIAVENNKELIRKLWDSYYVPYIKGYFASNGAFRSDDLKNKTIMSATGSSASAAYTPTSVIDSTGESPASFIIIDNPFFANKTKYAVQQGAGISVLKNSNDNVVKGCVEFIKWFTESERNISFSIQSSYMPVKTEALNMDKIESVIQSESITISEAKMNGLRTSIGIKNSVRTYTNKPFPEGNSARIILDSSLSRETLNTLRKNVLTKAESEGISEAAAIDALGYISDTAFDAWYEDLCEDLLALIS